MLGKLLKYEWKSTARIFLPLLVILAAFSVVNKILYLDGVREFLTSGTAIWVSMILRAVISTVYGILVGAAFIVTVLVLIQRFSKNLLGDEGYLMMTLPVTAREHILAKMLIAGIWGIINVSAAILSIMFMAMNLRDWSRFWSGFGEMMVEISEAVGLPPILAFLELAIIPLLGAVGGMLPIFACICLGQRLRKHKMFGAIVAYVASTTVLQIIFVGVMRFYSDVLLYAVENIAMYHIVVWTVIGFMVLWFGAGFLITEHTLSKKLNLE